MNDPTVPIYYKINRPVRYDDSTINVATAVVSPTENQTETVLNSANTLTFDYAGSTDLVLVHALRSEFRMKLRFKTRGGNPLDDQHDANTTLANNFWSHIFNEIELELGSETVESIKNLPVVVDVPSSLESDAFREYGSLSGYIPDQEKGDIQNRGFAARKAQYNYDLEGADDAPKNPQYRQCEIFVPLRFISGFCKSFNRATASLRYRIKLHRNGQTLDSYHGAANTAIDLKLQHIQLELETFTKA